MSRLSIILIGLLVLTICGFAANLVYQAGWPRLKQPQVTVGVLTPADRYDWDKASTKVTNLLKKRFPVGSPAANVMIALRGDDFQPLRQCPDPTLHKVEGSSQERWACAQNWDPEHALHYTWGRSPCMQDLVVWWTDDSSGHITNIEAQYACAAPTGK
jgi:hypothetical protein